MWRLAWARPVLVLAMVAIIAVICPSRASAQSEPSAEKFTVLSYHEIADKADALIPEYAVTPTMFVRQIDWLRNNGYNFVSVDDIMADKAGKKPLPPKAVLITFDDGYRSAYDHAFPFLRMLKIPSVVAVVGAWEEEKGVVNFDGKMIPREKLMTWAQLRELAQTGLVEIGSHTYDLHRGLLGNPQGNMQPAATTRRWLQDSKTYEDEAAYKARVSADLKRSRDIIKERVGVAPRVIAWPYGRYSYTLRDIADKLGMTIGLTLDDGANVESTPLWALRRVLVESNMSLQDLRQEMFERNQNFTENDRPQKIMHVDLDYIYDKDPAQQEKNLGHLLDRIQELAVNVVYLQAFADPDANGSADAVYFPNRHMPMRADLFNRVAWQIKTRTQVRRVYAWMPLLAWEPPATEPGANDKVVTLPSDTTGHVGMGYKRLSLFSPKARQLIKDIYDDLAHSVTFEGILFHDDATLSDFEDASAFALKAYKDWGLPDSIDQIRKSDDLIGRWTILKINAIDEFAKELADTLRSEQPALKTARNLYARVALTPKGEVWYSQALDNSLQNYDFTAVMAMPYMEQAADPAQFYKDLIARIKTKPDGLKRVIFELQTIDWAHDNRPIPIEEITSTIRSLYEQGVQHIAYYPDQLFKNHPAWSPMRATFAAKSNTPAP
ncbi:MAG TPA: poly-beta-1,6-N-acetyl-D-glucosamine N-deacetylase PgaB [Hyphomonadaceae bacterium]|nr:poly-beta-1,6-N-acetyl-D-glucosamine N-deacetylase PgaB [Hyphomonadaceae bacterium]